MHIITPTRHLDEHTVKKTYTHTYVHTFWQQIGEIESECNVKDPKTTMTTITTNDITEFIIAHTITLKMAKHRATTSNGTISLQLSAW